MGINYGLNRVRFMSAVPSGSRIRGRFVPSEIKEIGGGFQVVWTITIEREGSEKPSCVAEWLVRYFVRSFTLADSKFPEFLSSH